MVDEPIEGEGFTRNPDASSSPPSVPVHLSGSEVGIDPTGPFVVPNLAIANRVLGDHKAGVLGEVVSAAQKAGGSVLLPEPEDPSTEDVARRARATPPRRGGVSDVLRFQNNHGRRLWVAVGYYSPGCSNGGDWAKKS